MEKVSITTEYIKLDQLLKHAGIIYSGAEAKSLILDGMVKVNGEVETRRGKKIRSGDIIEFEGKAIQVE